MPVEMLTYADLGERLKVSPEAARALVKRHRWPRSRSNDGKTLVQVDLSEFTHSPISRPPQAQAGPSHSPRFALWLLADRAGGHEGDRQRLSGRL